MGNFCSTCFKGSDSLITPDAETRRQEMARAAERRIVEQEQRGIKNPDSVRRNQQRALEQERIERETAGSGAPGLRWTQD